jgi:hypothetical protein
VAELRHPRVAKEGTQTRLLFKKRMFRCGAVGSFEAGRLPLRARMLAMRGRLAWLRLSQGPCAHHVGKHPSSCLIAEMRTACRVTDPAFLPVLAALPAPLLQGD